MRPENSIKYIKELFMKKTRDSSSSTQPRSSLFRILERAIPHTSTKESTSEINPLPKNTTTDRSSTELPLSSSLNKPDFDYLTKESSHNDQAILPVNKVHSHRQNLVEKLQELSQKPATYEAAMATIVGFLARLPDVSDKNIEALRKLLPELLDPADILSKDQKLQLISIKRPLKAEDFATLNQLIETINNLSVVLKSVSPTLSTALNEIKSVYQDLILSLIGKSGDSLTTEFIPDAYIVGDCIDFGRLTPEMARQLLGRDRFGNKQKKPNAHGGHLVTQHAGVFYKPNVTSKEEKNSEEMYIQPGMEYAIYSLLQLLGGDLSIAAPTAWVKLYHIQRLNDSEEHDEYIERLVQVGLGIPGVSFQDLLQLITDFQDLRQLFSPDQVFKCIHAVLQAEDKLESLLEKYHLLKAFIEEKNSSKEKIVQNRLETTPIAIIDHIIELMMQCLEELPKTDQDLLIKNWPKGLGVLLNKPFTESDKLHCRKLLQNEWLTYSLPHLLMAFSILPDCLAIVTHKPLSYLINLIKSATLISTLLPNANTQEIYESIPTFLSRLDLNHFSATFIGHLLAKPSDAKPDNFQVRLIRDPDSDAVVKFQIVGIDNDHALANPVVLRNNSNRPEHITEIKCVLFMLEDALEQPIAHEVKERLLSRPPILWFLDWAKLLYEHSQRCSTLIDQQILKKDDLEELADMGYVIKPVASVDIPLKVTPTIFSDLYQDLQQLINFLAKKPNATHRDLLKYMQPVLAEFYQKLLERNTDLLSAFTCIYEKVPIENVAPKYSEVISTITQKQNDYLSDRTLSVPQAIVSFFDSFDWNKISASEQRQVLEYCGSQFPGLKLIKNRPIEWLNQHLLDSASRGLSGAVNVLLEAGAQVNTSDEASRSALHLVLRQQDHLDEVSFLKTLSSLFQCSTLDCHSYDASGSTPLITLIRYANPINFRSTIAAIELLVKKGVDLEQTDKHTGESALDKSIVRDNPYVFMALLRFQAGIRLNVDKAHGFLMRYSENSDYKIAMKQAQDSLAKRNSEYAYRLALAALCVEERIEGAVAIEGTNQNSLIYLLPSCAKQFLTSTNDFQTKKEDQYGRRNVVVIYNTHEGRIYRIHAKENPELPGMEFAVGTLRRQLFGHGAPYTELFKFTNIKNISFPVLFSKTIEGFNFHTILRNPVTSAEIQNSWDEQSLGEMIISAILINPEDDKPDNYIVEVVDTPDKKLYRLVCVDNDHAFVEPLIKDVTKRTKLQVKCILFCLDIMKKPLHPLAIAKFLRIDPHQTLKEWLMVLSEKQEKYTTLFSNKDHKRLLSPRKMGSFAWDLNSKNSKTPTVIPIPITPEIVVSLYNKILMIQQVMMKNPYLSGLQLLRSVIPELGVRYGQAFETYNTAYERFDSLTETLYSKAVAGRYGTLINSNQVLQSLNIPDKFVSDESVQSNFSPAKGLQKLEDINAQSLRLDDTLSAVQRGQAMQLAQLDVPQHREQVVSLINWTLLKTKPEIQNSILKTICTTISFLSRLKLAHCTQLTSTALTTLFKNSPSLRRIDLSYCPAVDNDITKLCEKYTVDVEVLILQGTLLTLFKSRHLSNLRRLILLDCLNLESIIITGPDKGYHNALATVIVNRSINLKEVEVYSSTLTKFDYDIGKKVRFITKMSNPQLKLLLQKRRTEVFYANAIAAAKSNQHQMAVSIYGRLLKFEPNNPIFLYRRGKSLHKLNHFKEAIIDFDESILLNPKNANAFMYRAESKFGELEQSDSFLHCEKVLRESLSDFDEAINRNSDLMKAYLFRGVVNTFLNLHISAIKDFDMAVSLLKNNYAEVYVLRGQRKLYLGLIEEAIDDFDKAINIEPENIDALKNRGVCSFYLRNFKEAVWYFDKALATANSSLEPSKIYVIYSYKALMLSIQRLDKDAIETQARANFIVKSLNDKNDDLIEFGSNIFKLVEGLLQCNCGQIKLGRNTVISLSGSKQVENNYSFENRQLFQDSKLLENFALFYLGYYSISYSLLSETISKNPQYGLAIRCQLEYSDLLKSREAKLIAQMAIMYSLVKNHNVKSPLDFQLLEILTSKIVNQAFSLLLKTSSENEQGVFQVSRGFAQRYYHSRIGFWNNITHDDSNEIRTQSQFY